MIDRRNECWDWDVSIEYFGGVGPIQAWGTVAGKRFYFRARHDAWSFGIALDPALDPVDVQVPGAGFLIEETYGANSDASYMPEDAAEAVIRRCASLFHQPIHGEGKFLGQSGMARVGIGIDLTASKPTIAVACQGPTPTFSQGEFITVPAEGFDDWKQGAVAGVAHALALAGDPSILVTITSIQGMFSDTNPTIVGAAAIDAIWKALRIKPDSQTEMQIQQAALSSWDRSADSIPEW